MKRTRIIVGIVILLVVIFIGVVAAVKMGFIVVGDVDKEYYKVRGITVSEKDGKIDWSTLANVDKISYAFVKATEGTIIKDEKFVYNFNTAIKNGIIVGPYHEFTLESDGKSQATHFINTYRSKAPEVTPPTVKVFAESDSLGETQVTKLKTELEIMMKELYNKYDKEPILYTDNMTYQNYLRNDKELDIYPIFIENTKYQPMIIDDRDWTFWQYDREGELKGVKTSVPKSVYVSDAKDFSYFYKGDFLSQQREFNEREKQSQKK